MFTNARPMITGAQNLAPSGSSMIPTRKAANAPNFINTPAWNMDTAVGSATCPSGLQLWKGKIPPKTAKPKKTKGNQNTWKLSEKLACASWIISKVFNPDPKYNASPPTRETTEPMKRYRVSFMAAYSRVLIHPQMEINRYIGKTAIS